MITLLATTTHTAAGGGGALGTWLVVQTIRSLIRVRRRAKATQPPRNGA